MCERGHDGEPFSSANKVYAKLSIAPYSCMTIVNRYERKKRWRKKFKTGNGASPTSATILKLWMCVAVLSLCGCPSVHSFSSSSPDKVSDLMNRAFASVQEKNTKEAFDILSRVYALDPNARGLQRLFEQCLQLRIDSYPPNDVEGHKDRMGLSSIFLDQERYEEAAVQLRQVISSLCQSDSKANQDILEKATSMLFRTNAACCQWDTFEQDAYNLLQLLEQSIQDGTDKLNLAPHLVHPFEALKWPCISLNMATQIASLQARRIVVATAKDKEAVFEKFEFPPCPSTNVESVHVSKRSVLKHEQPDKEKIRLGYLSPDFTSKHPLAFLMQHVFRHHDRGTFSVHLYSLTRDSGPEVKSIMAGSDTFTVLSPGGVSPHDLAQQIAADDLDILIDLCGYAGTSLVGEIMSCRPAPMQVSYMGFPGSTGAPYLDYMVVDPIVVPSHLRQYYTEHMIYMPHCYFVNSHATCASSLVVTDEQSKRDLREQCNLSQDAFVFCCHSRPDKIDPYTFRTWLKALVWVRKLLTKEKKDAVLWLLRSGTEMEEHLRSMAQDEFGLEAGALVFADVCERSLHLQRLNCADVFLDTPAYNAHTLGCDTLFAGVPMISLLRPHTKQRNENGFFLVDTEKLPSRVGASLLMACGLDELVCPDMDAYGELMIKCATDKEWFQGMVNKLKKPKRKSSLPLFDTQRWVQNLEVALQEIAYKNKQQEEQLVDIIVEDD